ncbi:phospho-sugar mutase [Mechercharimyces sp. CAU 1602]|uniref:phospho-sugar mutase n=1 Tax=Mechercharimyces sp. CAU 1602 TaxID=2973933 RepID=UPI0021622F17|nr:phospho-sugar mutase [Mechercharimyces sp. CAU 1602]MCS1350669.1 phospho-sugar mutase [Mechercharimyces sp. CAU 1602]
MMQVRYQRWLEATHLPLPLYEDLHSLSQQSEIEDRFYRYLPFGTAGMRGIMGAGTNRMNIFTIRRAVTAMARYMLQTVKQDSKHVVIAYDSRHGSRQFAEEAAAVLAHHDVHAHLFSALRPTPLLSFAVRKLNADGGIMITASHNPPQYNGMKLYGADGGQLPPHASEGMLREMTLIEDELSLPSMSWQQACMTPYIHLLGQEMDQAYLAQVKALSLNPSKVKAMGDQLEVVYTPLHGTGSTLIPQALASLGLSRVHEVEEQSQPDGSFPTVSVPNPEETAAFALALNEAKIYGADMVIATDPDADRIGVAISWGDQYRHLSGNELGVLLLYYVLSQRAEQGNLPLNGVICKTIVTSEMGCALAQHYGVKVEETLTGFKFIGEKIGDYERSGSSTFLFGYEESYGYLIGDFVRDKDAVQTAALCAEMAAVYKQEGKTLCDILAELQQQYGYYQEEVCSYEFIGRKGEGQIYELMESLRHSPVTQIGKIPVQRKKDYRSGIDGLPSAEVIKFQLTDQSWLAVRPSGTEPKIKFYVAVVGRSEEEAQAKMEELKSFVTSCVREASGLD